MTNIYPGRDADWRAAYESLAERFNALQAECARLRGEESSQQRLFPTPKGMMARIADLEDEVERLQEQAAFANDWRYGLEHGLRQFAAQQRLPKMCRNSVGGILIRAKAYAEERAGERARKRREDKR